MNKIFNGKLKYFIVIASILLVAGLGAIFVNLGLDWFQGLNKPSKFVPSFIFGLVWTVVYSAFAVVLCLWLKDEELPKNIIILLISNGLLNVVWCLLFFTFNNTILGLVAILINLILAFVLSINIYSNKKVYGYILSIYPLWLAIATCLNLAIWVLN